MTYGPPDWFTVLVLVFVAGVYVYDRVDDYFSEDIPEEGTSEYVAWLYSTGEIPEEEMERRIGELECPENEKIRTVVEQVPRVGEDTSLEVAMHFDTFAEFQAADEDELAEVYGVGEKLATAIDKRTDAHE
jgi:ERCC4-type nuclease